MVDLRGQYEKLKPEIDTAILRVLSETNFILGPNLQAFEQEVAEYLGVRHAIGCASGTDALHLALLAAGIEPGDEVITTAFTFIATAEAICHVGAIPIFVDIFPDSFNIDPYKIATAVTEKTRAIIPVHLFGQPADLDEIRAIASQYNLLIIEDCAQSFGSRYHERMTGSIGDAGAFSFFPSKNLGCFGDGGLVTTNDDEIANRVKKLRHHGSSQQYHHDVIGYNSRLDELQAVVLRIKLNHINEYNQNRLRVAQTYNRLLAGAELELPVIPDDRSHVFHQYTLLSDDRDRLQSLLRSQQIASAVYYPVPLHRQQAFADIESVSLPVADETSQHCLSLPIFPEMTEEQVQTVCQTLLHA
jgi:dTDP-4-amino-4,6-dideoxygalactose transaminase